MKTRYLLMMALGALTVYGCHDDSAIQVDVPCTTDRDCTCDLESEDGDCTPFCIRGYCRPEGYPECEADNDCADNDADHQNCLFNGKCGKYVEFEEACPFASDEVMCREGYTCMDTCFKLLSEGEPCRPDKPEICDTAKRLSCIDGTCVNKFDGLDKGEACNSTNLKCAPKYTCIAQDPRVPEITKCTELVGEGKECDESKNVFCQDGLYCRRSVEGETSAGAIKHVCARLGNECYDNSECIGGDSYCCLDKNKCDEVEYSHCVPFDPDGFDEACIFDTKAGIFESQIQCRWQPDDGVVPSSKNVEITPLVGKFHNKNEKEIKTVVAFYSYSSTVLRFMNPETCETLESLSYGMMGRWNNYPTAADLDGDGYLEIVYITSPDGSPVAFKWNEQTQKHEVYWKSTIKKAGAFLLAFDVNQDGAPEIVIGDGVINGQTGKTIVAPTTTYNMQPTSYMYSKEPSLGYFDDKAMLFVDGKIKLWNKEKNNWDLLVSLPASWSFTAYADFGTPGAKASDFDFSKLDGKPEFVTGGGSSARTNLLLYALAPKAAGSGYDVQELMKIENFYQGGPITIGDFNSDGLPEIGVASHGVFGVYDPKCKQYEEGGCADKYVLWERWSQDHSSGVTGSTLFDFDGDGQAEGVYGDECFTRVYDGKTGKVLFSSKHSSGTSNEAPMVADIDGDGSAEIVMGSAGNIACTNDTGNETVKQDPTRTTDPYACVDPIHEGIKCMSDEDCPSAAYGSCNPNLGLCICESDNDCNSQYLDGQILQQYVCAPPIHPDTGFYRNTDGNGRKIVQKLGTKPENWKDGDYKVCRATRISMNLGVSDLLVYKDRLDRWVDSRKLWNQHAYNIININDDGSMPNLTQWLSRFTENVIVELTGGQAESRRKHNNYRLNAQGEFGAGKAPDITGVFKPESICGIKVDETGTAVKDKNGNNIYIISGNLCNRGTKPVGSKLPATFFYVDDTVPDHRGEKLCTSYTDFIVGVGECYQVGCEITKEQYDGLVGQKVLMVSNLDEYGFPRTVECRSDNNTDEIVIDACNDAVQIDN